MHATGLLHINYLFRLTTLVLKTLYQAEKVTFVDHDALVNTGFRWLLQQVDIEGNVLNKTINCPNAHQSYF
jgi:hypothetical protein